MERAVVCIAARPDMMDGSWVSIAVVRSSIMWLSIVMAIAWSSIVLAIVRLSMVLIMVLAVMWLMSIVRLSHMMMTCCSPWLLLSDWDMQLVYGPSTC